MHDEAAEGDRVEHGTATLWDWFRHHAGSTGALALVLLLGTTAFATWTGLDRFSIILVLTTGLAPILYLPAYPALAWAILRRHYAVAVPLALICASHILLVALSYASASAAPCTAERQPARVVTANLYHRSSDTSRIAAELAGYRPDLVVLQETTDRTLAPFLRRDDLPRQFQQIVPNPRDPAFGLAVLSRWPLEARTTRWMGGYPTIVTDVATDRGRFRLLATHIVGPSGGVGAWHRHLRQFAALAAEQPRPLLIAGDFNATVYHRSFRAILAKAGTVDVASRKGKLWSPTWARGKALPPLLRIDHILVSQDFSVRHIHTGKGSGSDHRPVVADLGLCPRR